MKNIALNGACGRMGRFITEIMKSRTDGKIVAGIDIAGEGSGDFPIYRKLGEMKEKPDVLIDFTHHSALPDILAFCKMNNVPVVLATTGYSDEEIADIKAAAEQIPIFFTYNMSLGINLLSDLARRAVQVLGDQFDVEIVEKHHNQKKDAPSGTAIMLANVINDEYGNKMQYVYDRHNVRKEREKTEIGISSIRGGTIVGEHEIIFAGHQEVITLSHSAQSREVFAVGAVNAAIFMAGKGKGLYDMSDLLAERS